MESFPCCRVAIRFSDCNVIGEQCCLLNITHSTISFFDILIGTYCRRAADLFQKQQNLKDFTYVTCSRELTPRFMSLWRKPYLCLFILLTS